MRFKPFFVHFNNIDLKDAAYRFHAPAGYRHRPRGFTLYVQPSEHPQKILVSGAWCNYRDQFNKASGRKQAQHHAEIKEINSRHLAPVLAAMKDAVVGWKTSSMDYDYIYKYML